MTQLGQEQERGLHAPLSLRSSVAHRRRLSRLRPRPNQLRVVYLSLAVLQKLRGEHDECEASLLAQLRLQLQTGWR